MQFSSKFDRMLLAKGRKKCLSIFAMAVIKWSNFQFFFNKNPKIISYVPVTKPNFSPFLLWLLQKRNNFHFKIYFFLKLYIITWTSPWLIQKNKVISIFKMPVGLWLKIKIFPANPLPCPCAMILHQFISCLRIYYPKRMSVLLK